MTFYRHLQTILACSALATGIGGCTRDVASSDRRGPGDAFDPSVVLSGQRADEAIDAMRAPAAGAPVRPLAAAPSGVRLEDAPMAIRNVAGRSFVGVTGIESDGPAWVARTVMPDGREGTVRVERAPDGSLSVVSRLAGRPVPEDDAFARDVLAELRRLGAFPRPL